MSNDLGIDRSGNGNNWTVNNITYSDQVVDSPTNNFATWNPLFRYTTAVNDTYSEGNLKVEDNAGHTVAVGTIPMTSGKWYWEVYCIRTSFSGSDEYGMFDPELNVPSSTGSTPADVGTGGYFYSGNGWTKANGSYVANPGSQASVGAGDIIAFAYDVSAGTLKIYVNNSLQKTLTVAAQASYVPSVSNSHGSYSVDYVGNFGQDSSFAGNKTAQGNQDSNDIGDFYYTPPTGFLALCTKNLPDVDVVPSEHFNTITYTGTDADNRAITGVGFQPDFAWFKRRNTTTNHGLFDVLRGANKRLSTNLTDAEFSDSNALMSFDSDGYTVSSDGTTNAAGTYVAWNWKANGSGSSNTNGTITSTVSANVDAGFSIVSYTGNGTDGATVGHGLSKAPEIIIIKGRTGSGYPWAVFGYPTNSAFPYDGSLLQLESTNAMATSTSKELSLGASTVTFVDSGGDINGNTLTYIAYAFHSVDGYSKVGSYTGNASNATEGLDGTFVYTGFRPAWVMCKLTTLAGESWLIKDSERSPLNPADGYLYADQSAAEATGTIRHMDFLSNGFKFKGHSTELNGNGHTYIYIAFAETPFKYSNAR